MARDLAGEIVAEATMVDRTDQEAETGVRPRTEEATLDSISIIQALQIGEARGAVHILELGETEVLVS